MGITNAKRSLSALLGAALLSVGFAGLGTAAYAAPGDAGTGSITVHKYSQPEAASNLPNDGRELSQSQLSGLSPLADVGFTAVPIENLPLGVADNWGQLKNLNVSLAPGGEPVISGVSGVSLGTALAEQFTSADGVAQFAGLPADTAYVVYESTPLEGTTTVAQPSIVTVPYPGEGSEAWNYDVHLYPKNVVMSGGSSKTATVVGDRITFDVNYLIGDLGRDNDGNAIKYTQFLIEDTLSAGLSYTGSHLYLVDGASRSEVPDSEYTLSVNPGTNELSVNFTNADGDGVLTYLQQNIGKTIQWEISALAGPDATSTENTATLTVNGASWNATVPDPQPIYNGAYILKQAKNKGASDPVALAGAGFEIWSKVNAASIATCPAYADLAGSGLQKVNESAVVSGTDGRTPDMVLAKGSYCVYETVVPAGYKGATTGTLFTVDANNSSVTVLNTQFGSDDGDLPTLPITGAAGKVLMMVGAAALVAMASGLYLVRRRKMSSMES